jgi:hypothetical protein
MLSLSINGVPYSDTKRFMLEVHNAVEGDWDRVESALFDLLDDEPDEFAGFVFAEAVRMPKSEYHNDKSSFRAVRAESSLRSKPKGKK